MDGISAFVAAAASEAYDKNDKRWGLGNCSNFLGTYQDFVEPQSYDKRTTKDDQR
jgi:hypothetical protein